MKNKTSIIVAVDRNNAIGRGGDMPYHISADLRRFKSLTMGCPVVMGRKTFESLPKGALPGRRNIVITRNETFNAPDTERAGSLGEALRMADTSGREIFIIGGGEIYRQAMPIADTLYLTLIDDEADSPDTFFPTVSADHWIEIESGESLTDERSGVRFRFVTLSRKQQPA